MRGRPTTRSEETRRKLSADVLKRPKSVDVPEMKPVPKKSGGAKPQQRTEIKKTAATNGNTTKAYTKLRAEELRAEKSESSSENEEDEGKKETKIETTRGSFVQSGAETNTTFNDPRKRAEVAMEVEELVNPSGPPPNTFWPSDAQWLRANGHSELSYEEKCDARNLYRGKNPPLVPKDMEWLIENDYAASNYEDHVRALVEDKQGESKFSSEDVKWLILAGFGGCDKDERDRGCDERDREFALEQRNKGKPWPKGLTGQVSTDLHNSKLSKVKEPEDPDKVIEAPPVKEGGEDKSSSSDEERSDTEKESADGALRGELLGAMAGLCAQNVYKAESAKLFKPLFEKALRDATDLVREAAVKGLIYIDTTRALKILRKDFVNDSSIEVRQRLIELAGEVGGEGDLVWLVGKIGTTAESEPAWQAMLKIFKRSEAGVLAEWIDKFDSPETKGKLSDEQKLSVLEIGERKAVGENKPEMIKNIREKLASLYSKNGKFAQAADYLGMLHEAGQSVEEKEPILARLVDVYLRGSNVKAAKDLLDNYLLQKDLEPNSVIVRSIENYLTEPAGGVEPKVMLEALSKIVPPEPRPKWQEQLKLWTDRLGQVKWSVEAEEADN